MKISRLLAVSLLGGASCLAANPTHADKVVTVGSDSITIQTHEKSALKYTHIDNNGNKTADKPDNEATYRVTPMTEITVDNIPGKLNDVLPGMEVSVTADMSPTDAASIVAHTLVPGENQDAKDGKGKGKKAAGPAQQNAVTYKDVFHKITGETIISVTSDRITVGQGGATTATAYLITPFTTVTVNGSPGSAGQLHKGMSVTVNGGSENSAASIAASDGQQ